MICLYKNKLPNYGENTHYFFNNANAYIEALGDAYLTFLEDRYTMNGNIAEVQTPATSDVDNVTYISWYNSGVWRFYYVRSAVYQSGYVIFTLEVDLWATHISRATLSNIRVTRCNRNIGVGVYDPIPVTQGRDFVLLGDTMTADDLAIVYVVAFATGVSSILGNNAGTALGVFVNELSRLYEDTSRNTIDEAVSLVSGIYSAAATIGDLDANVLKAYIVPKDVLAIKTGTVPVFNIKSPTVTGTMNPTYEAAPFIFRKRFEIEIDPNNKYFVGTKHSGLELARVTGTAEVFYNFILKQDGLQVIVQQGDRMLDITDAFQVGLTSNDGNLTAAQQIARVLQTAGGIASGAFQIVAGGAGYVTGALTAANALQGIIEQGNARYTQGGDGVSTFRLISGAGTSPYYMQTNASVDDESANARLYGAAFNQQVNTIDDIFAPGLLGTGTLSETFFAAEIRVDGVQSDARDTIAAAIRSGVYAVKL